MDALVAFNLLRKNGNCICGLKDLKDEQSSINFLINNFGIKIGKTIKSGANENTVVVLEAFDVALTDDMEEKLIDYVKSHPSKEAIGDARGEYKRKRKL